MPDPFKLIILPATKVGMARAELHHYLEFSHGPMVMNYPDVSGGLRNMCITMSKMRPCFRQGAMR